jgi:hypothetical protein
MKKIFKEWDAITIKFLAFVIVIAGAVITISILYSLFEFVKSMF